MATQEKGTGKEFILIGNHLCLDLVNTQIVQGGRPVDLLESFDDLVAWLMQTRVIDTNQASEIVSNWSNDRKAEKTFERAREFREILRRTVERIVEGQAVPQAAVAQINELLQHHVGHGELRRVNGGFEKHFRVDFGEPIHLLWPVAESACDLLAYGNPSFIKKCENAACVLFFYDLTKNHSRRWCRMSACGNRMKAAAHYRRLRTPDAT